MLVAVGAALVMFVGIAITLLGQLGQRADDAVMQDGLPLATDDLGGDFAPVCSDSALNAQLSHFLDQQKDRHHLTCGPYQLLLVLDTK